MLKSRIISGNPPTAAQIKGPTIKNWGRLGLLAEIDEVATEDNWDTLLPEKLKELFKVDGRYSAAPLNIHRANWLWVNPKAFTRINHPIPRTWQEFLTLVPLLEQKGYTPLALGKEDWQYTTLFENVLLGTQGADFYRQAIVALDHKALKSTQMVATFQTLARLRAILKSDAIDQSWDNATSQLVNDKAAVQLSGDWVKGELTASGIKPGVDILCIPSPGTENTFIYNIDSLVMFNTADETQKSAQKDLARLIMAPAFQQAFNLAKGSIPIRQDISLKSFDLCSQDSFRSFKASVESNTIIPSLADQMAVDERTQRTFFEVIDHFFKNPEVTPEQATSQLATAINALR